jgi:UDP-N-acetylglucosamine 2-epimerase
MTNEQKVQEMMKLCSRLITSLENTSHYIDDPAIHTHVIHSAQEYDQQMTEIYFAPVTQA